MKIDITESDIAKMVLEGVKRLMKEGYDTQFTMERIKNFDEGHDKWYKDLYAIKEKSWQEHGNRNCPELEHCFWAMRLLDSASQLLNQYYQTLSNQQQPQAQPAALQEGMCEGQNWADIINNGMVHKILPAFLDTFGHEYEQNVFDPGFMARMLEQAPQEKQDEFMARLNGTYQSNEEPIDLDIQI